MPTLKSVRGLAAVAVLLCVGTTEAAPRFGAPGEGPDVLASQHRATHADSLVELAVQHDVGYVELLAANPGVDPWLPGEGREIVLPIYHLLPDAPNEGIVINIADMRLYFFPGKGEPVQTYPLGVGREGFGIPFGQTKITLKRPHPTWVPPPSVRAEKPDLPDVVPPGPDNPLGDYALNLGWPLYRIHGTNRPYGVGRRVSHGCIRLYPADIEALFKRVSVGTPVTVVDQATKVGWIDGELYIEVHPSGQEIDSLEESHRFTPGELPDFESRITQAAGDQSSRLNWETILLAWEKRTGLPTRVTGSSSSVLAEAKEPISALPSAAPAPPRASSTQVEEARDPVDLRSQRRTSPVRAPAVADVPGRGLW